jgi:hypothetical protein
MGWAGFGAGVTYSVQESPLGTGVHHGDTEEHGGYPE